MAAKTGLGNSPTRTIRGPHETTWNAAAEQAAKLGESRNAAIIRLITEYADGQHPPPDTKGDDT